MRPASSGLAQPGQWKERGIVRRRPFQSSAGLGGGHPPADCARHLHAELCKVRILFVRRLHTSDATCAVAAPATHRNVGVGERVSPSVAGADRAFYHFRFHASHRTRRCCQPGGRFGFGEVFGHRSVFGCRAGRQSLVVRRQGTCPVCRVRRMPNHALQRTAASRLGFNRDPSQPPSLSLGR